MFGDAYSRVPQYPIDVHSSLAVFAALPAHEASKSDFPGLMGRSSHSSQCSMVRPAATRLRFTCCGSPSLAAPMSSMTFVTVMPGPMLCRCVIRPSNKTLVREVAIGHPGMKLPRTLIRPVERLNQVRVRGP
eukprot:5703123-Amphidinium_carterae.1